MSCPSRSSFGKTGRNTPGRRPGHGRSRRFRVTAEEKALLTVTNRQEDVPYLFMNTTYGRIYGVTVPRDYHVLLTIESYGQTICTVYERMEKGMWRD